MGSCALFRLTLRPVGISREYLSEQAAPPPLLVRFPPFCFLISNRPENFSAVKVSETLLEKDLTPCNDPIVISGRRKERKFERGVSVKLHPR